MSTSITSSALGKRTYKIIFLGDSNTGKTSIIQRFVSNEFQEKENSTIGIDFLGKNLNYKGTTCRLQLWDTAGQERFKSLIPTYLKDAVCAIFVFDVNQPQTLKRMNEWIEMFRQNRGEKTVSVLCGNKSDLEQKIQKSQIEKFLEKHKMPYHTVSAKTGQNIDDLFYAVLDQINQLNGSKNKKIEKPVYQEGPLTKQPLQQSSNTKAKLTSTSQVVKKKTCC